MNQIDLSPLSLYYTAGPVGKSVMIALLLGSVWNWLTIFTATYSLLQLRRQSRQTLQGKANVLLNQLKTRGRGALETTLPGESVGDQYRRVCQAIESAISEQVSRRTGQLASLAVLSNVAPFVGLFGTVWGIIVSFAAIAGANDTSLATVAPGIAEALAATAYGLAVAIPSSMAFNFFSTAFWRTTAGLKGRVSSWAVEIMASTPGSTGQARPNGGSVAAQAAEPVQAVAEPVEAGTSLGVPDSGGMSEPILLGELPEAEKTA